LKTLIKVKTMLQA
jgi:hypothetical protein